MPNTNSLNYQEENDLVRPNPGSKTLYDVSYGEVFLKGLWAGFSLGLGRALASLVFWGIIVGFTLTYALPTAINMTNQLIENTPLQQLLLLNSAKSGGESTDTSNFGDQLPPQLQGIFR